MDDHAERQAERREPHALRFGLLASLLCLSAVIQRVMHSEEFSRPPANEPVIPLPPQPAPGSGFDRVTPKGMIVEVQSPPRGRGAQRAEALSGWLQGTPESVYPTLATDRKNRFHGPSLPFPTSGSVAWLSGSYAGPYADLSIHDLTTDGRRKMVRLVRPDGTPAVDVFLGPAGRARMSLPLGMYRMAMATGRRWEGAETMFGPYGAYVDLGPTHLEQSADQVRYTRTIGGPPPPEAVR